MKTKLWMIAMIAATAFAAPVSAQDGRAGVWAPWTEDAVQMLPDVAPQAQPRVQRVQVVATAAPQAPSVQETVVSRLFHIDRFWVIGSFR